MADFEVHCGHYCGSYQPPAAGKFARFRARCNKSNMADFEGHAFNTDLNSSLIQKL